MSMSPETMKSLQVLFSEDVGLKSALSGARDNDEALRILAAAASAKGIDLQGEDLAAGLAHARGQSTEPDGDAAGGSSRELQAGELDSVIGGVLPMGIAIGLSKTKPK